jgi:hypothetical protein
MLQKGRGTFVPESARRYTVTKTPIRVENQQGSKDLRIFPVHCALYEPSRPIDQIVSGEMPADVVYGQPYKADLIKGGEAGFDLTFNSILYHQDQVTDARNFGIVDLDRPNTRATGYLKGVTFMNLEDGTARLITACQCIGNHYSYLLMSSEERQAAIYGNPEYVVLRTANQFIIVTSATAVDWEALISFVKTAKYELLIGKNLNGSSRADGIAVNRSYDGTVITAENDLMLAVDPAAPDDTTYLCDVEIGEIR